MRNLLLGFTVTLLAVVQSSPLNAVTQIPPKAENDVFQEARNDGYLVRYVRSSLLATESPKTNLTTQSSQQPTERSQTSDAGITEEASGDSAATMATVPNFMASTVPNSDKLLFSIDSTQSVTYSSPAPDHSSVPQTTQPSQQPTEHSVVQTPLDGRKTSKEIFTEEANRDSAVTMETLPESMVSTVPISDKPLFIIDATQSVFHSSLTPDHRSVLETIQATDFSSSTESNTAGSGDGGTQSVTETYTRTNSQSYTNAPSASETAHNTVLVFNTESNIAESGDGWTQSVTETYTRTNSQSYTNAPSASETAHNTVFGFNTESNIAGSGDGWTQSATETYTRTNSLSSTNTPSASETTHNTVFGFNTESTIAGSGGGWTQSVTEISYKINSSSNIEAPSTSEAAHSAIFGFNTESNIAGSGDEWTQNVTETSSKINSSSNTEAPSPSEAAHNTSSFPNGSQNVNKLDSSVRLQNTRMVDGTVKNDQNDEITSTSNLSEKVREEIPDDEPASAGHQTAGWIIILGFLVGLTVLVLLCVAVATRDNWNRPNQVPQPEAQANSSNKQMEVELEELMHKQDKPREHAKLSGYIVIPLDELPENGSLH